MRKDERQLAMHIHFRLAAALFVIASASAAFAADPLDAHNVVLDAPGKDFHAAVPVGNGDIGASVWVEEGGDLVFY
ncbi:MAG: DUF5703 domain-containing protein, partial [Planctomycetota bacterium]|nr:DUF5703 domain-containing protein [Planctomycetota bacterium]